MSNGFPYNFARVILHPIVNDTITLEVTPDSANCKAAFEVMQFLVDWTHGKVDWEQVVVCGFRDEQGNKIPSDPESWTFPHDSQEVGKINFQNAVPGGQRTVCKYEVHFHLKDSNQRIILDPTVILRPGDWTPTTGG